MRSNYLYVFKSPFGNPHPLISKYGKLKKKQSILFIALFILHGCHFTYYHNTLASLGLIMLFQKYGNFKNILFLM
jgi:hypothetical protein